MSFSARPPAKLNLTLEVGPVGSDGYHPLRSIFLRIGLSDRLVVQPTEGERDRLAVGGPLAAPVEGNLVLRAASLLRARLGLPLPRLAIELDKHIPTGGGLGGGSSDGAAMLDLAAACWGVGLAPATRLELGAALGSDVPFFAADTTAALVEGRGELVRPLRAPLGLPGVLLVTPAFEVSTGAAFARFDALERPPSTATGDGPSDRLAAALEDGLDGAGLADWVERLRDANDLWPASAILVPALTDLRRGLEAASGRAWLMTGSGSTLFAVYPSPDGAAEAGRRLAREMPRELADARLHATDLAGPDPVWRQP